MSDQGVKVKNVGEMKVASLWYKGLPFQETVPKAFNELMGWMKQKGLPMPAGSPWGLTLYYDDPKAVDPGDVRFKVAIPVPEDAEILAEGQAAVEMIPTDWVEQNGHQIIDAPREVMVNWSETVLPDDWVTEIHFPIESQ